MLVEVISGRTSVRALAFGALALLASCSGASSDARSGQADGRGPGDEAARATIPRADATGAVQGRHRAGSTAGSPDPAGVPSDARVVLVTGSTDGLGRELARRLAAGGDHVIVHGRDRERGAALVEKIESAGVGSAHFYPADFASLANVRDLAEAIRQDYERLDVLVNNAGILTSPDRRPTSADGHELHFQVNYLAGWLLTRLLLPTLRESAPARIVNVSSRSSARLDFDDIMLEDGYSASRAYGQSKLAQVMFTISLAEELEGTGVSVVAVHPATLMDTDLVTDMGMEPRSTVEEGAEAVLHAIGSDAVESGAFYRGTSRARAHSQAYDGEARRRLEALSRRLTRAFRSGAGDRGSPGTGRSSPAPRELAGHR